MRLFERLRFFGNPGFLVFLIPYLVYSASLVGMQNTQDFTNYALTKVFVQEQSLFLDADPRHSFSVDYAWSPVHNRIVSNREMGISLLGIPFFLFGVAFFPFTSLPFLGLHNYVTIEHKLQVWTYAAIPFTIGVGLCTLYFLLKGISKRSTAPFATILILSFGTLLWKYGTSFYRNGITGVCLAIAALAFMAHHTHKLHARTAGILAGIALGIASICDYVMWIPALLMAGLWGALLKKKRSIVPFLAAYLPFLFLAFAYNTYLFGSPIVSPYSYDQYSRFMHSFFDNFRTPILWGLWLNLFSNGPIPPQAIGWLLERKELALQVGAYFAMSNTYWGIFVQSPYLWFAVWGWYRFGKSLPSKKRFALIFPLIPVVTILALMSKWTVFYSANIYDSRYVLPIVPIIAMGLAFALDAIRKSKWVTILLVLAVFLSFTRAFGAMFMSFGPNYSGEVRFDPMYLFQESLTPWRLFLAFLFMFPNFANVAVMALPSIWLFLPIWTALRKVGLRSWYN